MKPKTRSLFSLDANEESKLSIGLTPNPANGIVELMVNTSAAQVKGTYQIMNLMGGVLKSEQISNNHSSIDVSSLPTGVYIVYAVVNGEKLSERLIVK